MRVQTHFCEAEQEVNATLAQYKDVSTLDEDLQCEAQLYAKFGLLGEKTVLAHATCMSEADFDMVREKGCGVAHCPVANVSVGGGFMAAPVARLLDAGGKVGLGTDSGGGWSNSVVEVMRLCVVVGNAREVMTEGTERRVKLEEAFWMATNGGARLLGLEGKVGRFEVGMEFDAVAVGMGCEAKGMNAMVEEGEGVRSVWEKWVMTGDDRNIESVWIVS